MRRARTALERPFRRGLALHAIAALLQLAPPAPAAERPVSAPPVRTWAAGAYSFSDELGGFHITGISGTGTKDDPIVVRQEFDSASPVTMVIRAVGPVRPFGRPGVSPNGFINMRIEAVNNSGLGWIEFEFELQELLDVPSTFGDGLSFDQRRTDSDSVWSDTFAHHSRAFEPYDRLLFQEGKVDAGEMAGFGFLITDFTPRSTFFLVQDPRIPFS